MSLVKEIYEIGNTDRHSRAESIVESIENLSASPKRSSSSSLLDTWYKYYAGYSYEFAKSVLQLLRRCNNDVVLDPWNGGGTTILAASHLGMTSIGSDLNPFAVVLSKAKLVTDSQLKKILNDYSGFDVPHSMKADSKRETIIDFLLDSLSPIVGHTGAKIYTELLCFFGLIEFWDYDRGSCKVGRLSEIESYLLVVMISLLRSEFSLSNASNPTWMNYTAKGGVDNIDREYFLGLIFNKIKSDLKKEIFSLNAESHKVDINILDSRRMGVENVADLVLTSPPYCTRIDYAVNNKVELIALGYSSQLTFDSIRKGLMGTTKIRGERFESMPEHWPTGVKKLLSDIKCHRSNDSAGYYYKNYSQYFCDAISSIASVSRALREGGRLALVLQNSYYKEVGIDLVELYSEICSVHGFSVLGTKSVDVKNVLADINTKSKVYEPNKKYRETLLVMIKD